MIQSAVLNSPHQLVCHLLNRRSWRRWHQRESAPRWRRNCHMFGGLEGFAVGRDWDRARDRGRMLPCRGWGEHWGSRDGVAGWRRCGDVVTGCQAWPMGTELSGAASVGFVLGLSGGRRAWTQCVRSHRCRVSEAPLARGGVLLSGCPGRCVPSRCQPWHRTAAVGKGPNGPS
jgi:hypothetical protein